MQGNYVKLLRPQVRDLGKRDGRSSISSTTSHRISHHVRSPGTGKRYGSLTAGSVGTPIGQDYRPRGARGWVRRVTTDTRQESALLLTRNGKHRVVQKTLRKSGNRRDICPVMGRLNLRLLFGPTLPTFRTVPGPHDAERPYSVLTANTYIAASLGGSRGLHEGLERLKAGDTASRRSWPWPRPRRSP
jgi:hypothetical protein